MQPYSIWKWSHLAWHALHVWRTCLLTPNILLSVWHFIRIKAFGNEIRHLKRSQSSWVICITTKMWDLKLHSTNASEFPLFPLLSFWKHWRILVWLYLNDISATRHTVFIENPYGCDGTHSAQPCTSCGCVCVCGGKGSLCYDDRGDIVLQLPSASLLTDYHLSPAGVCLISFWCVMQLRITLPCIHLLITAGLLAECQSLWAFPPSNGLWMMKLLLPCSDMMRPFTLGLCDGGCQPGTLAFVHDS